MPRIRVTPEELGTASQAVLHLSEEYTSIYTQLMQQAGTMGEAWDGEDNLAFIDQINGFCEELKQMADKLKLASDSLKQQQTNYTNQQNDNITQVRKLVN
jgi:WXG100 family type VII secretion target